MTQNHNELSHNIAFFCSYIPNEIFHAAGLHSTRVFGARKPATKAKGFFPTYVCSYAMNCLDTVLENQPEFSGFIFANSCHAMESLYEITREFIKNKPSLMVNVPRDCSEQALDFFSQELNRFIHFLENTYQVRITSEKLQNSIEVYNTHRNWRAEIEKLIVSGKLWPSAEQQELLNRKSLGDLENFAIYANQLIESVPNLNQTRKSGPRIMITGSVFNPLDIARVIEEYGGNVILCDNCDGLRNFELNITKEEDPIKAIAKRYLSRPACGRQNDPSKRIAIIKNYIESYHIDGLIVSMLQFCPDQSYGAILLTDLLKELGIPFLVIDSEYSETCSNQIHTRIQAFLERF